MIRCPSCSEEVPANTRFCHHCGECLPQPTADGDIVAIRSTVIKAGTITLGAEADGGECPICGRHNARTATFRCKGCNRPLICANHQDPQLLLCSDCVKEQRRRSKSVTVAPDGTGDFATLEEAVMQCIPETTISLLAGEYRLISPLIITKSLSLTGTGIRETRVVGEAEECILRFVGSGRFTANGITFCHEGQAWANVVEVLYGSADLNECEFSGGNGGDSSVGIAPYHIRESDPSLCAGLLIGGDVRARVVCCVTRDNSVGIKVQDSSQPTLENNSCERNGYGILYTGSLGGLARSNTCNGNTVGIKIIGGTAVLKSNVCTDNTAGIMCGAGNPSVEGNQCLRNDTGICVFGNGTPCVVGNVFQSNKTGMWFYQSGGRAYKNNCSENDTHGINVMSGAPRVSENVCSNNGECGILVMEGSPTISRNECNDNGKHGIEVWPEAKAMVAGNRCAGNAKGDYEPPDLGER